MDVENPLQEDNIPVAKLVCIEVMGQSVEHLERENRRIYRCKLVISFFTNLFACVLTLICFYGILFYLFMFPL
jgi:hypothetical protein